jgi:hypothetical protein
MSTKRSRRSSSKHYHRLLAFFIFVVLYSGLIIAIVSLQKNQTIVEHAAGTNDLYVSPSGSDSNNGSQSSPFATINKAASVATAGTIVHVAPGTYNESVSLSKSGTATAPITFQSDTKGGAKIVGGSNGLVFQNSGDYVHIIGFDITSTGGASVGLEITGSHDLVQGNHVHNLTGITCSGSPGGAGISDDPPGSNNVYDGNVTNNIGDYPNKCDYIHAIYVDDSGDILKNNISYNNTGNGIYTNHGSGSMIFANNLSFANAEYGIGINGKSGAGNITVENNILVGNGIAGAKTWSTVSSVTYLNNLVYNNPTNFIQDGGGKDQGTITADPQFVNYQANGSGDYHLKAGSPAIDAGVSMNAPTTDFDGKPRPQGKGIDIGPYESGTASIPSSQPSAQPTSVVPSFVCEGGVNCAGTPVPTVFQGTTPQPSSMMTPWPNPSNTSLPSTILTSPPNQNPSISVSPLTGGNGQNIINVLLQLLDKILQFLLQLFGIGTGGRGHSHHHGGGFFQF